MSKVMHRYGTGELATPSDTEIVITRRFDAPADVVFTVWSTVEHVRRWWTDPETPMSVCEIDLRVGGQWRYVFELPDGTEVGFSGTYEEIDRPHRIVYTERFESMPEGATTNVLALTEEAGVTTMTLTCRCSSIEERDMILATGMMDGLQLCFDRMEDIAAGLLAAT